MLRIGQLFFGQTGRMRAGWRIACYAALTALFAQLAVLLYCAPVPGGLSRNEVGPLIYLDALLCAAALASAWTVIRFLDGHPFRDLGFGLHGRTAAEVGQGLLAGFLMVGAMGILEAACGWARFGTAGVPSPALLREGAFYLGAFALAAVLEEILARGYVFQTLIGLAGRGAAVAITSGLFGLGHIMNPHAGPFSVMNTVAAGAWLALAYLKTRSLWLPTALHLSWNFSMAYLFGFAVSGLRVPDPLVRLQQGGPEWITGGAYGPEGGMVCTVTLLLSTGWILASPRVRPSPDAGALWMPEPPAPGPAEPGPKLDN